MKAWAWSGLLVVVGLVGWYWWSLTDAAPASVPNALAQTIDQCDLIATKAAAGLPEALPFQKQEKAARQSHVLEQCMQDRGYQENPAWVRKANVHLRETAQAQNISEDEVYETMRRQAMLKADSDGVSYWQKQHR